MSYSGGTRYRLIYDSLYYMVSDALNDLGWFDEHPSRKTVNFVYEPVENLEEVQLNTLAIADSDMTDTPFEIGSNLGEIDWTIYIDFYAENKSIGIDLVNDIRDILKGRMPNIGRTHPVLEVLDYRLATPTEAFHCYVEEVVIDKAIGFEDPYRRHWYTVRLVLQDHYGG